MPTEQEILAEQEAQRIVFDERQQKKVNELIEQAMGRAGKEARTETAEIKARFSTLEDELKQARLDLVKAKTSSQKQEAGDDIKALESTIKEMQNAHKTVTEDRDRALKAVQQKDLEVKRAETSALNIRKEIMLTQAANKINPFDVGAVVSLTENSIAWDAERARFMVVDPASQQPRLNSAFDQMTVDEFFAEYANKHPYMVKTGARPGTGSSDSSNLGAMGNGKFAPNLIFGKGSNSKLAAKLSVEDPKEYKRLKEQARQEGIINF